MTKIITTQAIEVDPKLLAQIFFEMDDSNQREFFEVCATLWDLNDLEIQVSAIKHNGNISDDALAVMSRFGDE